MQNANLIQRLLVLRKKSLRIKKKSNLFKHSNVSKLSDKVTLENCIFTCKYFNQFLPKTLKKWLTFATASHIHDTRWSNSGCLKVPSHHTRLYGRYSINICALHTHNYLQNLHTHNYLLKLHLNILFHQLP